MIADPRQADAIVVEGRADCVALARGFLDNPRWAWHAADALGMKVVCPPQYQRARPKLWPEPHLRIRNSATNGQAKCRSP
jgi:2,4-dienoyl-CoA reductase-like NADH-dependent reductase (Old Yellow Enzyme family)